MSRCSTVGSLSGLHDWNYIAHLRQKKNANASAGRRKLARLIRK
jgi:hypothetical protein